MRIEEVVSSFIMCIVSGFVLVGFTIAWFTNNNMPAVTSMEFVAAEMGSVKVALESGADAKDISELEGSAKYADIGVEEFTNVEAGVLAPGTYGQVTFYVTPINSNVTTCEIVPTLRVSMDGTSWYPVIESVDGAEATASDQLKTIWELARGHIQFFLDEEMTEQIIVGDDETEGNLPTLTWTIEDWVDGDDADDIPDTLEKEVVVYWKWNYEYPFTKEELEGDNALSALEQEEKIREYDLEDIELGNNISGIKFYFTFSAK